MTNSEARKRAQAAASQVQGAAEVGADGGLTMHQRAEFWAAMCRWNDVDDGFGWSAASNAILYSAVEHLIAERVAEARAEERAAVVLRLCEYSEHLPCWVDEQGVKWLDVGVEGFTDELARVADPSLARPSRRAERGDS